MQSQKSSEAVPDTRYHWRIYIWELPRSRNSRTINEVMSKVGGKGIIFEKVKLWANSSAVKEELQREVERRTILTREAERFKKERKGES